MSRYITAQEIMTEDHKINFRGIEAYVSDIRIDPESVPENMCHYSVRHGDDWGEPITLEPRVFVNHYADIITVSPIKFEQEDPNQQYISLEDEERQMIYEAQ